MARVPWVQRQCIICLSYKGKLAEEHIIPQSLGGHLTCNFLCAGCNSALGHMIEAAARTDPSIRLAVQNLRKQMPDLAAVIEDGQETVAEGPGGRATGVLKDGKFLVRAQKLPDGSLVQPTPKGRRTIKSIMMKEGHSNEAIQAALARFEAAPDNQRVEIKPGLQAVRWSVDKLFPELSAGKLLTELVPVKIAYEFLALHVNGRIYDENEPLTEVRAALKAGATSSWAFKVERLSSNKYEPFHGICVEQSIPHVKVIMRLFGWLAFRVHFPRIGFEGQRFQYTHRLDTGAEYCSIVGATTPHKMDR